ncbi:MAG TPA: hypothetical protein VFN35_13255 [Ktedonobacteraceae bacterium]|nr:hypothetical protein [Ktedonobacteraceae bacterium]
MKQRICQPGRKGEKEGPEKDFCEAMHEREKLLEEEILKLFFEKEAGALLRIYTIIPYIQGKHKKNGKLEKAPTLLGERSGWGGKGEVSGESLISFFMNKQA